MNTQSQNAMWGACSVMALMVLLVPFSEVFAQSDLEARTGRSAVKKVESKRLEEKREVIKEEVQERKQELLQRLSTRRQTVAARLTNNMVERNARLCDLYTKHLRRLSSIVDKIESRRSALSGEGVDTAAVEAAITTARQAIANASEAVKAQQQKTYELDLTGSDEFGQAVTGGVKMLKSDHTVLREALQAAQVAVRGAFTALKDASPVPTPFGLPTPN